MVALKPRAYPLDKEGRYLPNLYGLLKNVHGGSGGKSCSGKDRFINNRWMFINESHDRALIKPSE
jgi:hypothetical protein